MYMKYLPNYKKFLSEGYNDYDYSLQPSYKFTHSGLVGKPKSIVLAYSFYTDDNREIEIIFEDSGPDDDNPNGHYHGTLDPITSEDSVVKKGDANDIKILNTIGNMILSLKYNKNLINNKDILLMNDVKDGGVINALKLHNILKKYFKSTTSFGNKGFKNFVLMNIK